MDEVEALQNGVLPSAERYETSDDEGSSESDDDESEEEVDESSDGESEEDLMEESDEEDEIMAKPERVRGRGKRSQHQVVIEEAVMDDNWQNDGKGGKRSSSEVVISEMVKIAEQMSETSEQMKSSMKRKRIPRPEEVTVLSQDNNQIVLQVSKEGMTSVIPVSDASSGVPIMVEQSGQGGFMNIKEVMMDGVPTQIVHQEVVTEEEMDPEMMAAQLLQHVLPTEIITSTQTIPQEVVTSTMLQTVSPEQAVHEVVTIQETPGGQQTIVTQNVVPQEIIQEQLVQEQVVQEVQEIPGEEIIHEEIVQQEVVLDGTMQGGGGGDLQGEMEPTQIITDMGDGEMTTVVVTTEVVTTEDGGTTQVVMVEDQRTPKKRPAEAEPESEGKRKRKIRAPYSP